MTFGLAGRTVAVGCALGMLAQSHLVGAVVSMPPPALKLETVNLSGVGQVRHLRVAITRYSMRVIAASRAVKEFGVSYPTIDAVAIGLSKSNAGSELVVINGGFNKQDPLDPSGLLVTESLSMSALTLARRKPSDGGPEVYSLSGVLCVDREGKPSILSVDAYQSTRAACYSAVQAGPFVVEPDGRSAIGAAATQAANRLIACAPRESDQSFSFYYFPNARLRDVESALKPICQSALNLAGAAQAGMAVVRGGAIVESVGTLHTPLPSMIAVESRNWRQTKAKR